MKNWHICVVASAVSFTIIWPLLNRLVSYRNSLRRAEVVLELKASQILNPLTAIELYNLTNPSGNIRGGWSQEGQDLCISLLLKNMTKPGLFVEAGAYDGETFSNTLYLEKHLNWSGILIEPNPYLFEKLLHRHRRAKAINAGLFIHGEQLNPAPFRLAGPYSGFISQYTDKLRARIEHEGERKADFMTGSEASGSIITVPMYSLDQILKGAYTQKSDLVVDYLSLDTEGSELGILNAINFTTITIGVISIDHNGGHSDMIKAAAIDSFMTSIGFLRHKAVNTKLFQLDHIYYNPRYFKERQWRLPTDVRCIFDEPGSIGSNSGGTDTGSKSRQSFRSSGREKTNRSDAAESGETSKAAKWAEAAKAVPKRARTSASVRNYIEKPHVDLPAVVPVQNENSSSSGNDRKKKGSGRFQYRMANRKNITGTTMATGATASSNSAIVRNKSRGHS